LPLTLARFVGGWAQQKTRLRDLHRAGAHENTNTVRAFRRWLAGPRLFFVSASLRKQTGGTCATKRRRHRMSGPRLRRTPPRIGYQTRLLLAAGLFRKTTILIFRRATDVRFQRRVPSHVTRPQLAWPTPDDRNAGRELASFWSGADGIAARSYRASSKTSCWNRRAGRTGHRAPDVNNPKHSLNQHRRSHG
jgi:hypothetical protein